jgi:hypothetical protein
MVFAHHRQQLRHAVVVVVVVVSAAAADAPRAVQPQRAAPHAVLLAYK